MTSGEGWFSLLHIVRIQSTMSDRVAYKLTGFLLQEQALPSVFDREFCFVPTACLRYSSLEPELIIDRSRAESWTT